MIFFRLCVLIGSKMTILTLDWHYCCFDVNQPCRKIIYAFNIESQQRHGNGLIGSMKIMMVNQNNNMTRF